MDPLTIGIIALIALKAMKKPMRDVSAGTPAPYVTNPIGGPGPRFFDGQGNEVRPTEWQAIFDAWAQNNPGDTNTLQAH